MSDDKEDLSIIKRKERQKRYYERKRKEKIEYSKTYIREKSKDINIEHLEELKYKNEDIINLIKEIEEQLELKKRKINKLRERFDELKCQNKL